MKHKLKIKECYWHEVWKGTKTFEIRKNDRNYKVGDVIHFIKVDDNGKELPSKETYNDYVITYVFQGGEYGLDKDYCVFSIKELKE